MDRWTKFNDTPPPENKMVEVMLNGFILQDSWDGAVWAMDPSGQVNPMYWRLISAE